MLVLIHGRAGKTVRQVHVLRDGPVTWATWTLKSCTGRQQRPDQPVDVLTHLFTGCQRRPNQPQTCGWRSWPHIHVKTWFTGSNTATRPYHDCLVAVV